jgi:hypothetical protein
VSVECCVLLLCAVVRGCLYAYARCCLTCTWLTCIRWVSAASIVGVAVCFGVLGRYVCRIIIAFCPAAQSCLPATAGYLRSEK